MEKSNLIKFLLGLKKSGDVLDIGVGNGRDAIIFARNGFNVFGIDKSSKVISEVKNNFPKLKVTKEDIRDYLLTSKYDIILCNNVLHFLGKQDIYGIIKRIKEGTKDGGLNVIKVFTEENPDKNFRYLFKKDELKMLYSNWKILKYGEFITPIENHGGKPHRHSIAVLVARKN